MKKFILIKKKNSGFTTLEFLVASALSLFVFAGLMTQFSTSSKFLTDLRNIGGSESTARSLLSILGNEIRQIGNGVPFEQPEFRISDPLHDETGAEILAPTVAYPIDIATSTASSITYRINEIGSVKFLAANFDPTSSLTISLVDVESLVVGDPIYISNGSLGEEDGFSGTISSIDTVAKTITLNSAYFRSENATFSVGSTLEAVATVTLSETSGQIIRNSGFGDIVFADNANLNIDYLDKAGNSLTLPLSLTDLESNLGSLKLTVTISTSNVTRELGTPGSSYSTSVEQIYGLRSFNF